MKIITTDKAPGAIGPYVQAISTGKMVMTSGQLPVNPETGLISDAIEVQTHQALENVNAILIAAGLSLADVVKTTVFVKDLNDFAAVNDVYKNYFTKYAGRFPARSCVEVARLPKDARIEIEAIAIAP